MERHKCKLCFRDFVNGRALGGHMRSHMLNLPIQHQQQHQHKFDKEDITTQLMTESSSSPPYSFSSQEQEQEQEKDQIYELRENPKRSFRFVDPEFSNFPTYATNNSNSAYLLQDRESETESSKNTTRRRSKRTRRRITLQNNNNNQEEDVQRMNKMINSPPTQLTTTTKQTESFPELDPVSSVSNTISTTEEDVAFWLMMLSRDKWKRNEKKHKEIITFTEDEEVEEEEEEEESDGDDSDEFKTSRGKYYKCETCRKVFKSYQALGGHRASHKKNRVCSTPSHTPSYQLNSKTEHAGLISKKTHECPICFRVFPSGQALGGHKRSHGPGLLESTPSTSTTTKISTGNNLIDLNLPAPIEDDDQIEVSAVSDAEFVLARY